MHKYKLIGFSDIDKNAVKAYCQLHNVNICQSYGDIQNINKSNVEQPIDMLVGGTPCQDFASLGRRTGCLYKCTKCGYSYDPLTISIRYHVLRTLLHCIYTMFMRTTKHEVSTLS